MNRLRSSWMLFAPAIGAAGLLSQYVTSVELVFWLMLIAVGFYIIVKALTPVAEERANRRLAEYLQRFVRKKDGACEN